MQNQHAAIMRKLSDPDFQAALVNKSIGLATGLCILLAAFIAHDAWVWTHPPSPRYFFIDGKHPPRPVTALDSPIVDDVELLNWTVKAVLAPYNINFQDYPEQLNVAGRRFTQRGWASFAGSFIDTGNFAAMKKAMLVCAAQAQRAAVISEVKDIGGVLAYQIQVPIVQTCRNTQQQNSQKLLITALVVRTDAEDHPDGLAIDQLIAVSQ